LEKDLPVYEAESGIPMFQEIKNSPPSENKPIDEEKVSDYHQMVGLHKRIKQLEEKLSNTDPFTAGPLSDELERRKSELETLLEKRKFQGKPPL
jgi:hypothetical protein